MADKRKFRFAAPLVIICLSVGAAACAPMTPYNPDRLPPAQMSRIGEICHTVMGLPAGRDTHSLACQESLSRSLAARREVSAVVARRTCEARGVKSEPLAQCGRPPQTPDAPLPAPSARSYFSASNDELHRRERQACVAIGEDPATSAFAQCVADLAGNLFDADNPIWRD
jgi:hypothetical protein